MTKAIELHGKYAAGTSRWALVDDDVYDALRRYNWKAKPNGGRNHVYAVRTDAKGKTVRLARAVLAYDGPLMVAHLNHNTLDCRRENLRVMTKAERQLSRDSWTLPFVCVDCGAVELRRTKVTYLPPSRCPACAKAKKEREREQRRAQAAACTTTAPCGYCSKAFTPRNDLAKFCSDRCRKRAKRERQKAEGCLPPSSVRRGG